VRNGISPGVAAGLSLEWSKATKCAVAMPVLFGNGEDLDIGRRENVKTVTVAVV